MGQYLWVEVAGVYSFKSLFTTIREVAEHCHTEQLNKVLIDLRSLNGSPTLFDRYRLGMEIVRVWGAQIMAAVLVRPEIFNQMAENTAVNRGVRLKAHFELEAALQWLGVDQEAEHA